MTDIEKAQKIAIEIQERIGTSPFSFDSIVEEIMKMAKWKDEQNKVKIRIYEDGEETSLITINETELGAFKQFFYRTSLTAKNNIQYTIE